MIVSSLYAIGIVAIGVVLGVLVGRLLVEVRAMRKQRKVTERYNARASLLYDLTLDCFERAKADRANYHLWMGYSEYLSDISAKEAQETMR